MVLSLDKYGLPPQACAQVKARSFPISLEETAKPGMSGSKLLMCLYLFLLYPFPAVKAMEMGAFSRKRTSFIISRDGRGVLPAMERSRQEESDDPTLSEGGAIGSAFPGKGVYQLTQHPPGSIIETSCL